MHPLFEGWVLTEVSYESIKNGYNGFGADLFESFKKNYPEVFNCLRFFNPTTTQTNNVLALYESGKTSFAIQLDPTGEVIVLWNDSLSMEIGNWSKNPFEEAIDFITAHLLP